MRDLYVNIDEISKFYRYALRNLAFASGHSNTDDVLPDLAPICDASFYPDHILQKFLETAHPQHPQVRDAVQQICGASIFHDSGVKDAYAAPCAPLIFGFTELAAKSAANDTHRCYMLANADISNLGGLNRDFMRNYGNHEGRIRADEVLMKLANIPTQTIRQWAHAQGYQADILPIRAGGDEFRYVIRLTSPKPIDRAQLGATQIAELTHEMRLRSDQLAAENDLTEIRHTKEDRAPGVGTTVALDIIDAQHSNIEDMLCRMNKEIAQMRTTNGHGNVPVEISKSAPWSKAYPVSHPVVPAPRPYHLHDRNKAGVLAESLESYEMRQTLKAHLLGELADSPSVLYYNTRTRQTELNYHNAAIRALPPDIQIAAAALIAAERMRGLGDPVSRCYSGLYQQHIHHHYSSTMRSGKYIGAKNALSIDMQNLSGLNKVSESFANAILREVGTILETAYVNHFPLGRQRPPILRSNGGHFTAILTPSMQNLTRIAPFEQEVRERMEMLGKQSVGAFSEARHEKLSIGDLKPDTLIENIPPGREKAPPGVSLHIETLAYGLERTAARAR